MKRVLYHILLCCGLCVAVTDLAAQVCWESLDAARQRKTLAARTLHESVRRLYEADCECDEQTLAEAVAQMTVRCKDRNRAALYAYLYDRLHERRRVDVETDIALFQLYAEYMLLRMTLDDDCRPLCRWAYTLARHYVDEGGAAAFDDAVKRALGRRAKRYAEACNSLGECVRFAIASFEAGRSFVPDMTEPRHSATGFVGLPRADYDAEPSTAYPLPVTSFDESSLLRGMHEELLWRDGLCCMPVEVQWPGVECVACTAAAGDCMVLTGSDGIGVTLLSPVVATEEGTLFSVGSGGVTAARILPDATVELLGFASLPEGRLLHVKCSDDAVSVEMETSHGRRYYQWLPVR